MSVRGTHAFAAALIAMLVAPAAQASVAADKAIVRRLYAEVFNRHDLTRVDALLAPGYIQHHPGLSPGRTGFITAFTAYFKADPTLHAEIKRVIAEQGLVAVHAHWTDKDDPRGQAVVDIFRIEHGRIAEHWDVVQVVPKTGDPAALF